MNTKGLYAKGKRHSQGGIDVIVDGVKPIEVEVGEYKLCSSAMRSKKIYTFRNKTNKEILDSLFSAEGCEFDPKEAESGDYIICRLVVNDTTKKTIIGKVQEIVDELQAEKQCVVSKDFKIVCEQCDWSWNYSEGGNDTYVCHKCGHDNSKFEKGGLIAPNGKKSNLTPEQYKLVRTPAFKKWFGDWENEPEKASKVVDENGEPLVVYHGTNGDLFYEFMPFAIDYYNGQAIKEFKGNRTNEEFDEYIERYGLRKIPTRFWFSTKHLWGDKFLPCFLSIKNMFITEQYEPKLPIEFDGFRVPNEDGIDYYSVSSSNQIKLADGTNTTFDSNNPDIRFEKGGEVSLEDKYKEWKSLVNMSASELQTFVNSKEGKEAGLSRAKASELGISSGRDSARAILRMKQKPFSEWNDDDKKWMQKQINFIKRMSGNKGDLFDDKGNKTRKHTSLLIWGHNPLKKETMEKGGRISTFVLDKDGIEISCEVTSSEHAKTYNVDAEKPLYLKRIHINKEQRNKGKGKEALMLIEQYAKENNCDVIFGYVAQKAEFSSTKNKPLLMSEYMLVKGWLYANGYKINKANGNFYKRLENTNKMKQGGGITSNEMSVSEFLKQKNDYIVEYIIEVLKNDKYHNFTESKENSFKKIAESVRDIMLIFSYYDDQNPIHIHDCNDLKICFQQSGRRKGVADTIIYFAHMITQNDKNIRTFSNSKSEAIPYLMTVLQSPSKMYFQKSNSNILFEREIPTNKKNQTCMSVLNTELVGDKLLRVVTILPDQRLSQIENKKVANSFVELTTFEELCYSISSSVTDEKGNKDELFTNHDANINKNIENTNKMEKGGEIKNNWTELEKEVYENVLSKGRGLVVPSEKNAKENYPNLIEQEIVYFDGFNKSLRLTDKGIELEKEERKDYQKGYEDLYLPDVINLPEKTTIQELINEYDKYTDGKSNAKLKFKLGEKNIIAIRKYTFQGKNIVKTKYIHIDWVDDFNKPYPIVYKTWSESKDGIKETTYPTINDWKRKQKNELAKGIEVEKEHQDTINKIASGEVAPEDAPEAIAKDHIAEDKNYYDKLEEVENKEPIVNSDNVLELAINDIIKNHPRRKFGDLDFVEGKILYDIKDTDKIEIVTDYFDNPNTVKDGVYKTLEEFGYIENDYHDGFNGWYITLSPLGIEFKQAVDNRIFTLQNKDADMFPEDIVVSELEEGYEDIKSCLLEEADNDEQIYLFEGKTITNLDSTNKENWRILKFYKYGVELEHIAKSKLTTKKKNEKISFDDMKKMFKEDDIQIDGINTFEQLNMAIKLVVKCIDMIDAQREVKKEKAKHDKTKNVLLKKEMEEDEKSKTPDLSKFVDIVKNSNSFEDAYKKAKEVKGISPEVSTYFFNTYNKNKILSAEESFLKFWTEQKAILEQEKVDAEIMNEQFEETPDLKIKESVTESSVDNTEINEAIELLNDLLSDAKGKAKKEILEAIELLNDLKSDEVINDTNSKNEVYIEYLNKDKNFQKDKKEFKTYQDAVDWARKNLEKFNPDMINYITEPYEKGGSIEQYASGGYVSLPFNLKITGVYEFKTNTGLGYEFDVYATSRYGDKEDVLNISDSSTSAKRELGSIIVKNSSIRKLAKGETITAISSKGVKGKITRIKDLYEKGGEINPRKNYTERELKSMGYSKIEKTNQKIYERFFKDKKGNVLEFRTIPIVGTNATGKEEDRYALKKYEQGGSIEEDNNVTENPSITITQQYNDERGSGKKSLKYDVNYIITHDNGEFIELTGTLSSYDTGRGVEYEFEVDYFVDETEEQYYDENSGEIESQILDKFYATKFAKGGKITNAIDELYSKSGFINDDFNWKGKLLEMLQDNSIEAYDIYQSLSKKQKEEVLQEQFEMDNDMGSYGDEDIETSKENLEIILEDAKNGKKYEKYEKGGDVGAIKIEEGEDFLRGRVVGKNYRYTNDKIPNLSLKVGIFHEGKSPNNHYAYLSVPNNTDASIISNLLNTVGSISNSNGSYSKQFSRYDLSENEMKKITKDFKKISAIK